MSPRFIAALFISAAAALLSACGGRATPNIVPQGATGETVQRHDSSSFKVLVHFAQPHQASSPLLNVNGVLYGTTTEAFRCGHHRCHGHGTVYRIGRNGAQKAIYRFKGGVYDGAEPVGPLIDVNGTLYGTTTEGGGTGCGSVGCGTVYSLSTSGSEKVLYAFKGGSDGSNPNTGVIYLNGTFYGTTPVGGSSMNCVGQPTGCGTVYSLSPSGSETVLYDFLTKSDGWVPDSGLTDINGILYGTTNSGGVKCGTRTQYFGLGCGVVYSITTSGTETVVHQFDDPTLEAVIPIGGVLDVGGTLYGMTFWSRGAIYKLGLNGSGYKVIHYFQGAPDGNGPVGGLIAANGAIYGTTTGGGTYNFGTLFATTKGGRETPLHSFSGGPNGAEPNTTLSAVKNTLYGTTANSGCPQACSTAFSFIP